MSSSYGIFRFVQSVIGDLPHKAQREVADDGQPGTQPKEMTSKSCRRSDGRRPARACRRIDQNPNHVRALVFVSVSVSVLVLVLVLENPNQRSGFWGLALSLGNPNRNENENQPSVRTRRRARTASPC